MKVCLTTLAFLFAISSAQAGTEAAFLIRNYDDGDTTVLSPSLDLSTTFNNDRMKVGVGVASDILSSASSDVRTYSSKGKITDNRKEFSGNIETIVPDGTLGVGYIQSDEKDYHSKAVTASGTREFFQKNTVIGMGFSNGQDRVQSTSNKDFDEPLSHQNYSLSLTQVLSKLSLIQLIYDFRVESGRLRSPYRQAKKVDGTQAAENHPRTRNRNAMAAKYNYFFQPWELSLATTYRFYTDSWAVQSHTLEERLTKEITRKFSLSLLVRYYTQKKASFYQDYYSALDMPVFYTGNTTLATYTSILGGIRPQFSFNEKYSIYAKYEIYRQTFKDASDAGVLSNLADDKKLVTNAQVIGLGLNVKF